MKYYRWHAEVTITKHTPPTNNIRVKKRKNREHNTTIHFPRNQGLLAQRALKRTLITSDQNPRMHTSKNKQTASAATSPLPRIFGFQRLLVPSQQHEKRLLISKNCANQLECCHLGGWRILFSLQSEVTRFSSWTCTTARACKRARRKRKDTNGITRRNPRLKDNGKNHVPIEPKTRKHEIQHVLVYPGRELYSAGTAFRPGSRSSASVMASTSLTICMTFGVTFSN